MNRRSFLAAIPLVAVVAANQVGTREAIEVESKPSVKCNHGGGHARSQINTSHCVVCGAIYRSGRWWRVRPLTHPGVRT